MSVCEYSCSKESTRDCHTNILMHTFENKQAVSVVLSQPNIQEEVILLYVYTLVPTNLLGKVFSKFFCFTNSLQSYSKRLTLENGLHISTTRSELQRVKDSNYITLSTNCHTNLVKQSTAPNSSHVDCYGDSSCTLPPQCHVVWVSPKPSNVVPYPLQGHALVLTGQDT